MNTATFFTIIGSLGTVGAIYTIWDGVRKRITAKAQGDVAVTSAIALLQSYKERGDELEAKFSAAEVTIKNMTDQLSAANRQVGELTEHLGDAQAEVRLLRLQVKAMAQQLPGGTP